MWLVLLVPLVGAGLFFAINRREFSPTRCPALLYHRFIRDPAMLARYPGTESIFTITEDRFEEQLKHLVDNGFHCVRLQDIHDFLMNGVALPPRPILITADDGWTSNIEIMIPLLKKYHLHAAFFVTTSQNSWIYKKFQGLDGPLSRDQVRAIADHGFEIGSHSVTHPHLIELDDDHVRKEFAASKRWLEDATGRPCDFLSIPGNFYDGRIAAIARECGYRAVFTANVGSIHPVSSLWDVPRLIVEGNFGLREFATNLGPFAICTRKIIAGAKKLPPRLLGATRYLALREMLFASPLRGLFIMRRLKMIALAVLLLITSALMILLAR